MTAPRLYGELASWWPLLSHPSDYADEARLYRSVIEETAERDVDEMLELGSGGGNNASHMKARFSLTLVDLSPGMLEVSEALNPECEHVCGDMRSVRLGRTFDAVFVHDAVSYITTTDDLRAVVGTAAEHLRPGGVVVFVPDETMETFRATTGHGGHDGDGRALRYLSWTHPPEPGATSYVTSFVYLLKEGTDPVRVEYDEHVFGVFPRATWLELLEGAGLEAGAIRHAYGDPERELTTELFVGVRPRLEVDRA